MIELSKLEPNSEEAEPLNGTVQPETRIQVESPEPAQKPSNPPSKAEDFLPLRLFQKTYHRLLEQNQKTPDLHDISGHASQGKIVESECPSKHLSNFCLEAPIKEEPLLSWTRLQKLKTFCNKPVKGKCKLWMAIFFIGLILLIFISLVIHEASYRDEDENEILELASNKTFLVTLKIPEECMAEEDTLSNELSKRLTNVYNSSPALSRYFASLEIADSRRDNSTMAYSLHFAVPSEDDSFMTYMMNEELVLGILRQDFHDQSVSGCETLGTDPASLALSSTMGHRYNHPHFTDKITEADRLNDLPRVLQLSEMESASWFLKAIVFYVSVTFLERENSFHFRANNLLTPSF